MALFPAGVCAAHFGPLDDSARLAQVVDKATSRKTNADAWAGMAAYMNGLRGQTQTANIVPAAVAGIDAALAACIVEGNAFRQTNGL